MPGDRHGLLRHPLPDDARWPHYVPDDQLEAYTAAFEERWQHGERQPSGKNAVLVENNGYVEDEFDFDLPPAPSPPGYAYLSILRPSAARGEGHRP